MNAIQIVSSILGVIPLLPLWWKTVPKVYRFFLKNHFLTMNDYLRSSAANISFRKHIDAICMTCIYIVITGIIVVGTIGLIIKFIIGIFGY